MRDLASSPADYYFAPDSSRLDAIYQQIAGAIGGAALGLVVLLFACGRVGLARGFGVVAALLPLAWLPFFGTRFLLNTPNISFADIGFWLVLVVIPLALAAAAGAIVGGRLARSAEA